MSKILESPEWGDEVYQLSRMDKVEGGASGVANAQAQVLANRTRYLKEQLDAFSGSIKSGELPFTDLSVAKSHISAGAIKDGDKFSVRSDNPEYWVDEYICQGGQAVATGKSLLSDDAILSRINFDGNMNPVIFRDVRENPLTVIDDAGGMHVAGMGGSLQQRTEIMGKNAGPYLHVMQDKRKTIYRVIDESGEQFLPGIPGGIQQLLNRHQKKLDQIAKHRRVIDVRDYGFNPRTGRNAWDATQRAINELAATPYGGVVYCPAGHYPLDRYLTPASNVAIIGDGPGRTIFRPFKAAAAFTYRGASGYISDLLFSDFTIDGENQVLHPTRGYLPEIKAIFLQYYKDTIIDRLEIINIGATGLGVDMPDNCAVTRCYVENCGRLAEQGQLGASGIGLGTSGLDSEPIFVSQNVVKNCKNYGIFFEPQLNRGGAQDAIVTSNVCLGNYAGIADCGIEGLQVSDNSLRENKYGYLMYPGTNYGGKPGRRGRLDNNIIADNVEHGVYSECKKNDPLVGEYHYKDNIIRDNGGSGICFDHSHPSVVTQNMFIDGNDIYRNGGHGIHFKTGAVINSDVINNRIWNNGQSAPGHGIFSEVTISKSSITGNKIRDVQESATQINPVMLSADVSDTDISMNHCVGNAENKIRIDGQKTNVSMNMNAGAE